MRARLLPEDKLSALQELREKHGAVMFVGDGINDAPVLAGADVGAAMGSGADAAIEAADVVFMNADLSSIPASVQIARGARRISHQNIAFALGVKLLVMVLALPVSRPCGWRCLRTRALPCCVCSIPSACCISKPNKRKKRKPDGFPLFFSPFQPV